MNEEEISHFEQMVCRFRELTAFFKRLTQRIKEEDKEGAKKMIEDRVKEQDGQV